MKKLLIMFIILAISTPALSRVTCTPHIKKYWRSNSGKNVVLIRWSCSGDGNSFNIRTNKICAVTDNGKVTCGCGRSNIRTKGGTSKVTFCHTEYPIDHLFIER